MAETEKTTDVTALTVELLRAYLANNTVPSDSLAELIRTTRIALTEDTKSEVVVEEPTFMPAVSVRKSLASSAHILSLIDGKPYKTLRRHLSANGLTPDTYRARYKIPANYPMVAEDFAAKRREIAQRTGLGNRSNASAAKAAQAALDGAGAGVVAEEAEAKKPVTQPKAAKPSSKKDAKTRSAPVAVGPNAKVAPEAGKTVVEPSASAKAAKSRPKAKASAKVPVEAAPETGTAAAPAKRGPQRTKAKAAGTKATARPGASLALTAGLRADATASEAPKAENSKAGGAKPGSKPRGKLGLFGKSAPETDAG